MADLILHHFDLSPFAEKIRLVMGLKGLAWHSVQIPMIMPKPDLMPLTGGYRKTPVLQIGADVYCDTSLIARELERRHPDPTLFPEGGQGLPFALAFWSDRAFFEPGAGLSMGENPDIPEPVLEDRKAFFNFMDFEKLPEAVPHLYAQFAAHAQFIEDELVDGRDFLTGSSPGWIDIDAYFPVWMARGNIPGTDEVLTPLPALRKWESRMQAVGHGSRTEMDADAALDIAAAAEPAPGDGISEPNFEGLEPNQTVSVEPGDYGRVPVSGRLVTANSRELAVLRSDPRVGDVVVHFPRAGYRVVPQ